MCRNAFKTYKSHFACFACRKAFKKTALEDYVEHVGWQAAYAKILAVSRRKRPDVEAELGISYEQILARYLADVSVCPECGERMASMGLDFRPPPKRAAEAWEILRTLYEHDFAFHGCGCGIGYEPPLRKSELPAWLKQHTSRSTGEQLLEAIRLRST